MNQRLQHEMGHSSQECAVEIMYLSGACCVRKWEGESNERCAMRTRANGVKCGLVEQVKRNMLWWFGHMERKKSEEIVCE